MLSSFFFRKKLKIVFEYHFLEKITVNNAMGRFSKNKTKKINTKHRCCLNGVPFYYEDFLANY